MDTDMLKLNQDKIEHIVFHPHRQPLNPHNFALLIFNNTFMPNDMKKIVCSPG